jgi:hypothetical protein
MIGSMHRRMHSEDGFGLILVIGFITIITTLVFIAGTIAVTSLTSSRQRVSYEQAIATAENGVDFTLAHLQTAFDDYNADYPIPSLPTTAVPSPFCNGTPVDDPAPFTTEAAEKAWAKAQLAALLAAHPSCVTKAGDGDWLVLKPRTPLVDGKYPKYGRIYAMGWSPSRTSPNAKVRLVKEEYIFMPYQPTNAVLTGGDLVLDSSTTVRAAFGVDPTLASVHTNGSLSTSGNPTVTGMVTSTGSSSAQSNNFNTTLNPGGSVSTSSLQSVPTVNAHSFYFKALNDHPEESATWYDLCSDGYAYTQSAGGPCTGTQLNGGTQNAFNGWSYTSSSHTWVASRNTVDGTYYIDKGNVDVGSGNGSFQNITVIASADNPTNCSSKKYGNINWDHFDMKNPSYPNLWMLADSDIVTHSNFSAGSGTTSAPVISGMFVAGDQMQMETSSQGAVGSVVVGDQCSNGNPDLVTSSEIKNPAIWYDPNSEAPFTSIIDSTLWLEYAG